MCVLRRMNYCEWEPLHRLIKYSLALLQYSVQFLNECPRRHSPPPPSRPTPTTSEGAAQFISRTMIVPRSSGHTSLSPLIRWRKVLFIGARRSLAVVLWCCTCTYRSSLLASFFCGGASHGGRGHGQFSEHPTKLLVRVSGWFCLIMIG